LRETGRACLRNSRLLPAVISIRRPAPRARDAMPFRHLAADQERPGKKRSGRIPVVAMQQHPCSIETQVLRAAHDRCSHGIRNSVTAVDGGASRRLIKPARPDAQLERLGDEENQRRITNDCFGIFGVRREGPVPSSATGSNGHRVPIRQFEFSAGLQSVRTASSMLGAITPKSYLVD